MMSSARPRRAEPPCQGAHSARSGRGRRSPTHPRGCAPDPSPSGELALAPPACSSSLRSPHRHRLIHMSRAADVRCSPRRPDQMMMLTLACGRNASRSRTAFRCLKSNWPLSPLRHLVAVGPHVRGDGLVAHPVDGEVGHESTLPSCSDCPDVRDEPAGARVGPLGVRGLGQQGSDPLGEQEAVVVDEERVPSGVGVLQVGGRIEYEQSSTNRPSQASSSHRSRRSASLYRKSSASERSAVATHQLPRCS